MLKLYKNLLARTRIILLVLLFITISNHSNCQKLETQVPRKAVTHHKGVFNNVPISYTATVEENILFGKDGKTPEASIITFSYIKDESGNSADRPVIFLFNGGPGASSSPLHMHAFGPVIVSGKNSKALVNNNNSLLDIADLIFIDPVGTGYTRLFDENAGARYWDVKSDAESVIFVIKAWMQSNNRESSPLFICGESYGTIRLAQMLGIAEDLPVAGALMLSTTLDMTSWTTVPGNDLPYLFNLPTMAAVAFYHNKTSIKAKNEEEMFDKASLFAQTEYLSALARGNSLSDRERNNLAKKLTKFIGLPVQTILEKNLRITSEDYQLLLLADQDKRIGQLNGRMTGPLHTQNKPPYNDPSMVIDTISGRLIRQYFISTLNFPDSSRYKSLNLNVNAKWNWSSAQKDFYFTVTPELSKAVREHSRLRLFVAGGIFDMATPLFAAKYFIEHSGVPPDRLVFESFPTGHSIFEDEYELKHLSDKIRNFILK